MIFDRSDVNGRAHQAAMHSEPSRVRRRRLAFFLSVCHIRAMPLLDLTKDENAELVAPGPRRHRRRRHLPIGGATPLEKGFIGLSRVLSLVRERPHENS